MVISHTHLNNFSSPVFVCASYLREKLFAVILTQAQAQAEARIQQRALQEEGRKSDTNPPVLGFEFGRPACGYDAVVKPIVVLNDFLGSSEEAKPDIFVGRGDDRRSADNDFHCRRSQMTSSKKSDG
nr:uncharacterized protein LOC109186495 [Ipomoea batatas]